MTTPNQPPPEDDDRTMNDLDLTTGGTVRPITRWGTPVMHAQTRPVITFDAELHDLVRDMFATMAAAEGVGLAATQVGVDLAVFVYDCPDADERRRIGVVCNPLIMLPAGRQRQLESAEEGCLSYPGAYAPLSRPDQAICIGHDSTGADIEVLGTGMLARCLQHETDHLNGTVFGDRLPARIRKKLDTQHANSSARYPADWPVSPRRPVEPSAVPNA